MPKKFIKDLNIKYLRLNNLEKNNFLNKVSGVFEFNETKINGFKKIYLHKNLNEINLSLFKTSEIDTNKNTEKKQNIFNLVESLDIFALIQEKKIIVNKFKLNLDGGTINGEGAFKSSNDKISGEIILKSKILSILKNLIFNLDFQNKKDPNQTISINKFAANNINSEISLNYFFKKGDIDYKIKKLSVFIEDLNAKNINSKNVFYLNNGKVDYQPKKFQGFLITLE